MLMVNSRFSRIFEVRVDGTAGSLFTNNARLNILYRKHHTIADGIVIPVGTTILQYETKPLDRMFKPDSSAQTQHCCGSDGAELRLSWRD